MPLPIRFIATALGINARQFAEGWYEGHMRYKANGSPMIVQGSRFPVGNVSFAASQAAVAFYVGLEK